jgi:hypothetical protein
MIKATTSTQENQQNKTNKQTRNNTLKKKKTSTFFNKWSPNHNNYTSLQLYNNNL